MVGLALHHRRHHVCANQSDARAVTLCQCLLPVCNYGACGDELVILPPSEQALVMKLLPRYLLMSECGLRATLSHPCRRYGGHVTDPWDRRCTSAYLESLLTPKLLDQKGDFMLAAGVKAFAHGTFQDARAHVSDKVPEESPVLFGLHTNAEVAHLIAQAEGVFASILELSGAGGGQGAGGGAVAAARESKVLHVLTEMQMKLPPNRPISELLAKVVDRGAPYTVFLLQEVERLNSLVDEIKRNLAELELGLTGALNISDTMDSLISCLYLNSVPPTWLAACGQSGPTGSYNKKALMPWFADLVLRDKQLVEWAKDPNDLPVSAQQRVQRCAAALCWALSMRSVFALRRPLGACAHSTLAAAPTTALVIPDS